MASGITNTPLAGPLAACSLSVEYSLSLADHHALDMHLYDTVIRKRASFQLTFYAGNLIGSGASAAIVGLMLWGLFKAIGCISPRMEPDSPFRVGYGAAWITFALYLVGMIPGSFLHRKARNINDKRFWQTRLAQLQAGILRYPQRYRVVLTPEWFTETVSYREMEIAFELTEHKETRVWWAAVTGIDVTTEHAFFMVRDKGCLLLPRAAFAEESSFLAFVEIARDYQDAARRLTAPSMDLSPPQEERLRHGRSG